MIFLSNLFCPYECKPKQKYWKRKISHLKVFAFIFYFQSMSSLSSFFTKIEIKLRYNKISTIIVLSIKNRITMERLLCVILGFAEILTGFWSNLYKAGTCLQRTHWVDPVGVRYRQVSLYTHFYLIRKHFVRN